MKRIIALLIVAATMLSLAACKKNKNYPPVESTEEESRVVMSFTLDDKTYDVKYELYRAFFLTYKSEIDGGDPECWTGENKGVYIEKINEKIIERIAEIYSAFVICERIGFDLYSKDVENKINENIKTSVEGGSYGSSVIEGFDSYDDYLESLKAINLNYSVQTLLFRYAIAVDAIDSYYIGTASSDDVDANMSVGAIKYTREDVKAFYDGDDSVRVMRASFQKHISYDPEAKAEDLANKLRDAASSKDSQADKENAVFTAIMSNGLYTNAAEIKSGYVIGRYNLERSYFGEMTDEAFSLEEGEVSEPIEIVTDVEDAYYVLYRTYKSDEHFDANYDSIRYIYLANYVGEITHGVVDEIKNEISYTDAYEAIDHSAIAM